MNAKLWIVFENDKPQSVFSNKIAAYRELCNHIFFRFSWSEDKELVELYEAGNFEAALNRGYLLAGNTLPIRDEEIIISNGLKMCSIDNGIDESDYME